MAAIGTSGWIALSLAAMLCGCAAGGASRADGDTDVTLTIANIGTAPLRCTILFGHWVEQGAGTVAPGATLAVSMRRQAADGALYVPRYDGRRMYVENLVCGPLSDWWVRRADLPLLPVRAGAAARFGADCRMAARAECTALVPR